MPGLFHNTLFNKVAIGMGKELQKKPDKLLTWSCLQAASELLVAHRTVNQVRDYIFIFDYLPRQC